MSAIINYPAWPAEGYIFIESYRAACPFKMGFPM